MTDARVTQSSTTGRPTERPRVIHRLGRMATDLAVLPAGLLLVGLGMVRATLSKPGDAEGRPRLLWASTPIKSLAYMARAVAQAGYRSEVAVIETYAIYGGDDFDHVLVPARDRGRLVNRLVSNWLAYVFFARALSRYDIFHFYFDGGVLRRTSLARWELPILRALNKRIVLLPYGSDAFVYDLIPDPIWRHALMINYAERGDHAGEIQARVRRMTEYADVVVACLFHYACLPRWDVLPLVCYPVDVDALVPAPPRTSGPIRIAHAPNHRGVKGTEFLLAAIETLRSEGNDIELDLIERVYNEEALRRISEADIFVDQLVFGYALAAIEALALGKVVVSPIERTPPYDLFRQYSYLGECPIVSATARDILDVLRGLIGRRNEWPAIGRNSRAFAEHRHSYAAAGAMFEAIYGRIWRGEDIDLINLYHPLFEQTRLQDLNQA